MIPWRWWAVAAGREPVAGSPWEDSPEDRLDRPERVVRQVAYASLEDSPRRERRC